MSMAPPNIQAAGKHNSQHAAATTTLLAVSCILGRLLAR